MNFQWEVLTEKLVFKKQKIHGYNRVREDQAVDRLLHCCGEAIYYLGSVLVAPEAAESLFVVCRFKPNLRISIQIWIIACFIF
jgi:hypothetical protein